MPSYALISVPSSTVVWVTVGGGVLFRSTDRGETWEQRGAPPELGELPRISFISDREGWVLTVDPAQAQCPENLTIWRTRDGGSTYDQVRPSGLPADACGAALTLVDAQHAFLTGGGNESEPFVYRTSDAGATWVASAPPRAAGAPASALSPGPVRSFGSVLLLRVMDWSKSPVQQQVYRSTDGGASWAFLAAVPTASTHDPLALATATRWLLLSVPAQSSQETTDAGATWHPYPSDYQQAAPIGPALYFADADVGYATVRGTIQRTIDGGARWSPLHTPATCCN
ncbi:MAG: WD40/YVTN/BNR-like repeat-containing protein [Candidatus Limnocylindria bacterium]